jgi:hypothetical protein
MSTSRVVKLLDHRLGAKSENMVSYVVKEGAQTTSYIPLQSSSHSIQSTTYNLNKIGVKLDNGTRTVRQEWNLYILSIHICISISYEKLLSTSNSENSYIG